MSGTQRIHRFNRYRAVPYQNRRRNITNQLERLQNTNRRLKERHARRRIIANNAVNDENDNMVVIQENRNEQLVENLSAVSGENNEEELNTRHEENQAEEYNMPLNYYITKFAAEKFRNNGHITHLDIHKIVMTLVVKHNLTFKAALDIMKAINFIGEPENPLRESYYLFVKINTSGGKLYEKQFYCYGCKLLIGPSEQINVKCPSCGYDKKTYFISFQIKALMQKIIEKNIVKITRYKQKIRHVVSLADIHKGEFLQQLDGTEIMSYNFNFDGVAKYKSVNKSLWPILIIINDLPPDVRMLKQNCIIGGLWLSKKQPEMDIFLRPFVEEAKYLTNVGLIVYNRPIKLVAASMSVDTPARCKGMKMKSFQAPYGCTMCLQKGTSVDLGNCVQIRYEYVNRIKYRTLENHLEYAKRAEESGNSVYGVQGKSILFEIPFFEPTNSMPDELHFLHIGLVKRYINFLFDSKYNGSEFYQGRRRNIINKIDHRISQIHTYTEASREPRKLSERALWKGNEFYNFFFYYSIVFMDLLPNHIMENFQKLRIYTFKLLSPSIKKDDLDEIDHELRLFLQEYEVIFGLKNMVFNAHQLMHLTKSVKLFGPLWATSTFNYEGMNGLLRNMMPQPKEPLLQIALRYQLFHNSYFGPQSSSIPENINIFCESFFDKRVSQKNHVDLRI